MIRIAVTLAAPIALIAPAQAQPAAPTVLASPAEWRAMATEANRYPMFAAEVARVRASVDAAMRGGIVVPVPRDPGGGYTHEQHKRNYLTIQGAGALYRITGERRYADHVRDLLIAYAKLYPGLGDHPAKANQTAGRLFWQSLNDSVFLVHAIQGYDATREAMTPQERATIEQGAIRPMATFLSDGSARTFNRIHNHGTWAAAAVGMTGYVLGDRDLVDKALLGLDKSGKGGFLAQLDQLFSPDGYYAEGPYYQRYALQPFVVFADAIERNDPERGIFKHRDGIVPKAIRTAIQLTYDGHFIPINNALREKSLRTEELYRGVAIGYAATRDPGLLSIAQWQGRVVLSPGGLALARDLAGGKAKPFDFATQMFRDGPDGTRGALGIIRSGAGERGSLLVAKNTAQGMGHGHFDKLNWLFYDAGNAIVTDYGAARFLNIEAKQGGRYLPENDSWAKTTVAHNTLVVDETSHFRGQLKPAEAAWPTQLAFGGNARAQWSVAEMKDAYPGVTMRRALVTIEQGNGRSPLVVDLLRATGSKAHRFDLPLHYNGHLIDTGMKRQANATTRPVLGKANGYQHLWVDATASLADGDPRVTWMTGGRFYTYRMASPAGTQLLFVESGANDPDFNLRREPALLQRLDGAREATFVGLLEPHGSYDAGSELTVDTGSQVKTLTHARAGDNDIVTVTYLDGRTTILAIADDASDGATHRATIDGRTQSWTGPVGRFDQIAKDGGAEQ